MIRRLPAVRRGPFVLETSLSRVIDDMVRDFNRVSYDASPSFGRTDVYETDTHLVYETELPGVSKDDVSIKVEDKTLLISGEVKRDETVAREQTYRVGRRYGSFQRCFPLPANRLEMSGITAKAENGILRISAPLKESVVEEKKPLEIPVE